MTIPSYPAPIYAFATEPMTRLMSEEMKSGPKGDMVAELVKEHADWLTHSIESPVK